MLRPVALADAPQVQALFPRWGMTEACEAKQLLGRAIAPPACSKPASHVKIPRMSTPLTPIFDHFVDFLVEKASPQEILNFQIPEEDKQRAMDLLDKQDVGDLTPEETSELHQMQEVDRLISILKARASDAISRQS